jgi:uncharacterized protein YegL
VGLLVILLPVCAEFNLPLAAIERSAELFGQKVYETCLKATAITDLRTDYLLMDLKVIQLDGNQLVSELKNNIEKIFERKIDAVKKLVKVAESAHHHHTFQKALQISYSESKKLNMTQFELVEDKRFNNIAVNLTMSTVHVPSNLYDRSAAVLNGVAWSAALDEVFRKNYESDSSLAWQYFASHSGFFRNFPGTVWRSKPKDSLGVFDCRLQQWYVQAATSAKDVLILLDVSNSMKGSKFEVAKETVRKIIGTLTDDDFFNILKFSDGVSYVEPCLNGSLVQATPSNKQALINALAEITPTNTARHDLAIEEALRLFQMINETSIGSQCNKAVMLITGSSPSAAYGSSYMKHIWPDKEVRLFVFLIGHEKYEVNLLRSMACSNRGYFSQVLNMADVHNHVQNYVHVMSRPLALARAQDTSWTNVYFDNAGLEQVMTVVQPVYNTRNVSS